MIDAPITRHNCPFLTAEVIRVKRPSDVRTISSAVIDTSATPSSADRSRSVLQNTQFRLCRQKSFAILHYQPIIETVPTGTEQPTGIGDDLPGLGVGESNDPNRDRTADRHW